MIAHWHDLLANFAVAALFISAWVHGQPVVNRRARIWRETGLGLAMGAAAVTSMLLTVPLDGAIFDLRLSLVAIAGFFGGPLAGFIAAVCAIAYRAWLGGAAAPVAILGIGFAALVGVTVSGVTRDRANAIVSAIVLAVAVCALTFAITAAARIASGNEVGPVSGPIALLNMAATLMASFFIIRHRRRERERDLLRSAFVQSPDLQYIKTTDGRFVAVNRVLAQTGGYDDPAQMIGKSDADVVGPVSAEAIAVDDREIIQTGEAKIDFEEMLHDPNGGERWFLTSKVPLWNTDQELVGIAGWSRDITARKSLQREVLASRNQLNTVLTEMSDGIAMFDATGVLTYCNEQYRALFPRTASVRSPGRHIREILAAVAAAGEQRGIPAGREAEWVEDVAKTLTRTDEQEINLCDDRWLLIRTRPTSDGAALVVASDVTGIKQAESALREMTVQLRQLATTDGLTGVMNRRALDEALESELARTRRDNLPISLLLVDVDRFKAYNDGHGHPAGDEALKVVASCLKGAMRRPGDLVARYGGEEFSAILPGTSADGAQFIADKFRDLLVARALPHKWVDRGILTASVGIASFAAGETQSSAELIRRADEALYDAKEGGRDKIVVWKERRGAQSAAG